MINRIYQGHLARKRFGQIFLKDQFIIDYIVSIINPQKDQIMVEIGPGLAALTEPVSKFLDELIVIELDQDLAARLKVHPILGSKLNVYQQDVLTINFNKLAKRVDQPLRIFGNLPYNIFTPLIFHLFKYINVISDMHFMLQKEVVNRLIAKPNSKDYSRLSIIAQFFCNISPMFEVPLSAFVPQPKVDSALVRLVPHKTMPYQVQDLHVLNNVTTTAFNQRRKMIRNSLGNLFTIEVLTELCTELGIDLTMRAENISITQYCRLANYISDNMLIKNN